MSDDLLKLMGVSLRLGDCIEQMRLMPDASVDSIMDLDLFTTYDLDATNDAISVFGMKSEFHLASWCRLFMDGTYDTTEGEIATFNTRGRVTDGLWKAEIEHRYRLGQPGVDETSNLLAANVSVAPNKHWEFGILDRYEFESSRLEEQGIFVTRTLDCLAFRIGGSYLPSYTRTDGTRQGEDFRVSLQLWLTALPNVRLGSAPRN